VRLIDLANCADGSGSPKSSCGNTDDRTSAEFRRIGESQNWHICSSPATVGEKPACAKRFAIDRAQIDSKTHLLAHRFELRRHRLADRPRTDAFSGFLNSRA